MYNVEENQRPDCDQRFMEIGKPHISVQNWQGLQPVRVQNKVCCKKTKIHRTTQKKEWIGESRHSEGTLYSAHHKTIKIYFWLWLTRFYGIQCSLATSHSPFKASLTFSSAHFLILVSISHCVLVLIDRWQWINLLRAVSRTDMCSLPVTLIFDHAFHSVTLVLS